MLFLGINAIAYLHARAMTHFVAGGDRPRQPEDMTRAQKAWVLLTGLRIPRPENRATPASFGLAFETHRFPSSSGELEAWYVPCPAPRGLVLLLHGYSACKSTLLPEAAALRQMGWATLLLDFRGSGGSSGNETTVGVREAEDVAAACAYAGIHWSKQPLVIYGQSMGAAAALRAVAHHTARPQAVILESPFDRLTSTVANRFGAMGLPSWPGAPLLVFWGGAQCGFNGFAHNPAEYARAVHLPTLILHGAHDPRVTNANVAAVYDGLAGRKWLAPLRAGHAPTLPADPDGWKRAVREFLKPYGRVVV